MFVNIKLKLFTKKLIKEVCKMNLKKIISVMLASTAMCTAISGAANACPGVRICYRG